MIGTTIRNHILTRVLGSGGMGTVYYAEHVHAGSANARVFKVLRPELTTNETLVQRFLNEAKAAAKIDSPNIVRVRDWDKLANVWWIEMDWTPGVTLAEFLDAQGRALSEVILVHIGLEIANGLIAAHKNQIIHRDLKPENIWLGSAKNDPFLTQIFDFGVAKLIGQESALTVTGALVGTYAYMAPEALRGGTITQAVDVWALGAILYQMATGGWLPYQHQESRDEYLNLLPVPLHDRQRANQIVDPRHHNPRLSEPIAKVILTALDPDVSRRYDSARSLGLALAESFPGDGFHPSGIELAKHFAPEVLQLDADRRTVRDPHAIAKPPPKSFKYQLGTQLGRGGMAEVFRASVVGVEGFARPVAIKRVLAGFSEVPQFSAMFVEEAHLASKLQHQNIVSIFDFDRDPEGRLFLVMEFVPGKDLAALVDTGQLPIPSVIFILTEMLRGLQHAHESQLIHRDVSPHNVLLSWDGGVKVSDFGIAKALDADGGARSLVIKGKPAYMSPEQMTAGVLDPRSDLYAVGVVAWELLSGRRLHGGETNESYQEIVNGNPPRPSTARKGGVPRDLEAFVMKLLAREKHKRFQSAEQAIEALTKCDDQPRNGRAELARLLNERFPNEAKSSTPSHGDRQAQPATANARPNPSPLPATPKPSTLGGSASESLPFSRSRRRRWPIAVALIATAAAGAVVAIVATASRSHHQQASDAGMAVAAVHVPQDAARVDIDAQLATVTADAAIAVAAVPVDARMPVDAGVRASPEDATVRRPTVTALGDLKVYVNPWAKVYVDGTFIKETPVETKIAVGKHRVRIENMTKSETVTVTISPSKPAVIDKTW